MRIIVKGCLPVVLLLLLLVDVSIGAAGGPCDSSCTNTLNCCADQTMGNTCFNTTTQECTANKQICAKGLSLCGTQCYDGTLYDCLGTTLCPKGDQLCGADQCYDTNTYACISGTQLLRLNSAAECNGIGYNTQVNECVNGTIGPIRASTPCGANQAICGSYCYDPTLYFCAEGGNLTALPGFCGQGRVWCQIKCYDPYNYTCQSTGLVDWSVGDPCPASQKTCGAVCYNPTTGLVCTEGVVCPMGQGVCNNTCYNTTRYDCVDNAITMHPGYCPTGLGLCGDRCFNMSMYSCNRDILMPTGVVGCANSPCLSGDLCCSDNLNDTYCYESMYYECKSNDIDPPQLCGKGLAVCGIECYDSTEYTCTSTGVLCPVGLDYCSTNNYTGCYDKAKYTCLDSSVLCPVGGGATMCNGACINIDKYTCQGNTIQFVVCPRGQLNCAGTCFVAGGRMLCVNHTLVESDNITCPSGNCNGTCFDLTRAYCDNGQVIPKPTCNEDTQDLCFDECYFTASQVCVNDIVYVKCSAGLDRCNQSCFDEDFADCMNNMVVNKTCATRGLGDCSEVCYNMTTYTCKDGSVYPMCVGGSQDCGIGCYFPSNQTCSGGVVYPMCMGGQQLCSQTCYDPSKYHCESGSIVQNSGSSTTISITLLLLSIICTIIL